MVSVVQFKSFTNATSGSFTSNVSTGNSVILWICGYNTSASVISSSAPQYNGASVTGAASLFAVQNGVGSTSNIMYAAAWLLPNVATSGTSVSFTLTNSNVDTNMGFAIAEVSGLGATPALDAGAAPNPSTGNNANSTPITSGSTGSISVSELIVGAVMNDGGATTGPGAPWTVLIPSTAANNAFAGYQIASTGSFAFTATPPGACQWAAGVAAILPSATAQGNPPPPLPPYMFPPLSGKFGPNPPFEVQQPYPSAPAAAPSVPAAFFPPHSPLRGPAAAVKGKLASSTGRPGVPAAFRPPSGLLRGRSAAVKGTLARLAGRPGAPSPFRPPASLLRGPAGARRGKLAGLAAPPPVATPPPTPAPFRLPGLFRGRPAARPGRLAGLIAPPPVITPPSVPAPFSPAFHMLRGARSAAPGRLTSWRVQTFAQVFTASGTWAAPGNLAGPPAVYAWGESGAAGSGSGTSSGGGAGAGAFGGEPALGGVAPGTVLTVTVGAGGSGTATTVTGGTVTVQGNAGGSGAGTIPGLAGTAGTNTLAQAGGAGGAGAAATTDGGGGGGSGGSTGAGGAGATGATGGAGGTAGTGAAGLTGQPGGNGGTAAAAAQNGTAPGSGPGGGSSILGLSTTPGNPAAGQALIIWPVYVLPPVVSALPAPTLAALSGAAPSASRAAPSVPAPFFPPHSPLRGAALAVKGKLAGLAGRRGVPSPFRLPGLLRGQAAARPGKLAGIVAPPPVLHPVITSPLTLPPFPLRGHALARPGALTGTRGRPGVPSPFQPSHTVLRGQPAARKGTTGGTVAPPPVAQPNVPAPFFPPHVLLRGQVPATARTKITGGIAPPPAPPPAHPPHWQGSTHMIAAGTPGNLIQGANHTGKGGPGTDLKGDFQRSGD